MPSTENKGPSTIIPTLRYRDAAKAVDWLCRAFNFERHLIVPGDNGTIAHAELTFGNGMIMLGSVRDDDFGKIQKTPQHFGGLGTQSPYIVILNPEEHYARAVAAGAEIVHPLQQENYGGRGYACRDPEGYLWNFGTYNPWNGA